MGHIITEDNLERHIVQQYNFNNLDAEDESNLVDDGFQTMQFKSGNEQPAVPKHNFNQQQNHHQVESSEDLERRDQMINSLLDKVDSLSSELLKVQMKLEEQEGIFTDQIDDAKKRAYEDGLKQGQQQIEESLRADYGNALQNFQHSVLEVNQLSTDLKGVTESVEKELIKASVEIAKEVITSEISFNSGQVAISLSKALLKQIDDASDIKLHINSSDYDLVKDAFKDMENISIVPNRSVNAGGVIVVSDVGTIEGSIMDRFKNLKSDILSKTDI